MHVFSLVLPKHIREKGLYYEFLCLEQAGERTHNRLNNGEKSLQILQMKKKGITK